MLINYRDHIKFGNTRELGPNFHLILLNVILSLQSVFSYLSNFQPRVSGLKISPFFAHNIFICWIHISSNENILDKIIFIMLALDINNFQQYFVNIKKN